jgi:predicted nucleic acid-binding protein
MVVIADTSPLTALLHLKLIDLLPALYGMIVALGSQKAGE